MRHITDRDIVKRLASLGLVTTICIVAGTTSGALAVCALALATEILALVLSRIMPDRTEDIGWSLILTYWLNNTVATFAYLAPAIVLAGQPSVPFLLAGFIWVFGVLVHISNTFVALPYYNWTQMFPGSVALVLLMTVASTQGFAAGAGWEWHIATGVLIVYASNTVQTLVMQKDTHKALRTAREQADARLAELERLNRQDGLTGLLNRRAFDEGLARMLATTQGEGTVGVFVIDLDGFKPVNDSYSHEAGDQVLVTVGQRLRALAGPQGLAARLGGDEFAIARAGLAGSKEAEAFGQRIVATVTGDIPFNGRVLRVGASVGIGLRGPGVQGGTALCSAADQAMYRAKADPAGSVALYDPATFGPRITLHDRTALAGAMRRGEIGPHYQPKVDLRSGRLIGFEALARWTHPKSGLLGPAHFLPKIDNLGMQGDFLTHMAARVLADMDLLLGEGLDPGQVSINVPEATLATHSGRQDLVALLEAHPAAAAQLTIEITEDVFIARAGDRIHQSISDLRRRGLRVSLDDFGTGFASFQHLRELEFDELKIDQSFVAGLGRDHSAEVLIGGFLGIARGLGVAVIAEGVETDDQRSRLIALGAGFGQGWRFGRAVPLAEARARILAEGQRRAAG